MALLLLARDYLVWHYSVAYVDMLHIWWNYLWFVDHLFSVPDVLRSWISPFRRLKEDNVNILKDPETFFGNLFVNIIMRMVGFVIRTALILIALIAFIAVFAAGAVFIVFWSALPVIIVHLLISGLGSFAP